MNVILIYLKHICGKILINICYSIESLKKHVSVPPQMTDSYSDLTLHQQH